jgi:type VI secretion system protein ImpB
VKQPRNHTRNHRDPHGIPTLICWHIGCTPKGNTTSRSIGVSIQDDIPRSRINLRYRTEIQGTAQMLELPFRLMVLGDLSGGSATDREVDLESRRLRSLTDKNLDSVMENMRMSLSFKVSNRIDPGSDSTIEVNIPIKNRRSFTPGNVADSVPKIRSLLLLRKLLLEMQSNIDNRKDLRRVIQEIWSNPEQLKALQKELAAFADYKLPSTQKALAQPAQDT